MDFFAWAFLIIGAVLAVVTVGAIFWFLVEWLLSVIGLPAWGVEAAVTFDRRKSIDLGEGRRGTLHVGTLQVPERENPITFEASSHEVGFGDTRKVRYLRRWPSVYRITKDPLPPPPAD